MSRASNKNWGSSRRYIYDPSGIVQEVVTHAHEPGKIYVNKTQPNADIIMQRNQDIRNCKATNDLSFGRYLGSVPLNELEFLKRQYPELRSKDPKIRTRGWAKVFTGEYRNRYLAVEKY